MKKSIVFLLIIIGISTVIFYVSNHYLKGYLRSEITLAKEIKTPLDSINQYKLASEAPFKYRLLFPSLVKGSYEMVYDGTVVEGFLKVYTFWSLFFFISAACSFFYLLRSSEFSDDISFLGTIVFLLLPPMFFAYTLPVHTREDTLAYTLLFLGLTFLIRKRLTPFIIVSIAGVLCRETLLLLPFLYLVYADDKIIRRITVASVPVMVWIFIRIVSGHENYDVWLGLKWNLKNIEQVVGFLFITFNVCWPLFFAGMIAGHGEVQGLPQRMFFYRSAWATIALILVTTFLGGIFNEIRLLYLFVPWVVIVSLDFLSPRIKRAGELVKLRSYKAFAIICAAFCVSLLYVIIVNKERIVTPGKFAVPYDIWIISSVCYIFIFLMVLPIVLPPSLKKFDS